MNLLFSLIDLFLSILLSPFYAFSYIVGALISVIHLGYYWGRYDYSYSLSKKKEKAK
jgi:hypothetical protein